MTEPIRIRGESRLRAGEGDLVLAIMTLFLPASNPLFTWKPGTAAQLLLNTEQLIVFCEAITPTGRSGFDLSTVGGDGKVGNRGIFCLSGPVADDCGKMGFVGHFNGVQGFGEGADLIQFDQD